MWSGIEKTYDPTLKRSKIIKCSICSTFGHNAKTCKGGLTAKEKKKQGKKKKGQEMATEMLEQWVAAKPSKKRNTKASTQLTGTNDSEASTSTSKPSKRKKKVSSSQP